METKNFKFKFNDIDEKEGVFTGMASVYDIVDSYNEVVQRGAFKKTLQENNGEFPLCWFHDVTEPLGLAKAEDKDKGLWIEGQLNLDVQSAREKRSLMKQKVITGISIGFKTLKDEWDKNLRKLKEIKLYEFSPITRNFQACPGAEIGDVKSDFPEEFKPYPNEHSARLKDPNKFDKFRRKKDGKLFQKTKVPETISVIWGHLKDGEDDDWAEQSLRFPTKNWTVTEAKKWLKENDVDYIKFEPASKSLEGVLDKILTIETADNLSPESIELIKKSINSLKEFLPENEPGKSTQKPVSILSPIIEAMERNDKPQSHLSRIIKVLEN